jgi:hypothetical protein
MKAILTALILATLFGLITEAFAGDFDLTVGELEHPNHGTKQAVSVKNNTTKTFTVRVECGFFKDGKLIDTDWTPIDKIASGQTGFGIVASFDHIADRSECRISGTRQEH